MDRYGKLILGTVVLAILMFFTFGVEVKADVKVYKTTLHGPIGLDSHKELTNLINSAPKGSHIVVDIDSKGGSLARLVNWEQALAKRPDLTLTCIVGDGKYAGSAAAFFLLACERQVIGDDAEILFHLPFMIIEDTDGKQYAFRDPEVSAQIYFYYANNYRLKDILDVLKYTEGFLLGYDVILSGEKYKKVLTLLK